MDIVYALDKDLLYVMANELNYQSYKPFILSRVTVHDISLLTP
jgi:hypothetical protein